MFFLRQINQHAPGDRHLGRKSRALGADRILDHLNQQRLAFIDDVLDGLALAIRGLADPRLPDIGNMQKSGTFQADIDKCRLHARQNSHHLAQINIADEAARSVAFDMQFLDDPLLEDGNPGFLRGEIDEDTFGHG